MGSELPVFLPVLSAALRGHVHLTASLSVSSCLRLTHWLTDAPINHHGQGGLMRLVISLIPLEKKLPFGMGDTLTHTALILVHPNLFSSPPNWGSGLGRRLPSSVFT